MEDKKAQNNSEHHVNGNFCEFLLDNLPEGAYFVDTGMTIRYWNKEAERITGFEASEVVGQNNSIDILKHTDKTGTEQNSSGCPACETITSGYDKEEELFIYDKIGSKIPVIIKTKQLKDNEGNLLGAIEIFKENFAKYNLERKFTRLRSLNLIDPLTEAGNRKYAEINLKARFNEWVRYGWRFGLIFLSIDHLAQLSAALGDIHGKNIIRRVSTALTESIRPYDTISRWDENEFALILANVNETTLPMLGERCRVIVEECGYTVDGKEIFLSASIGATLAKTKETIFQLRSRAQKLMENSKNSGGNIVKIDHDINKNENWNV